MSSVWLIVLATVLIYSIAAVGLNLNWGDTGMLNFGVAAFFGIGAYTSVILTTPTAPGAERTIGFAFPIIVGIVAAFIIAAAVGALVGTTTARASGDYIAILTLAFDRIVRTIAQSEEWITEGNLGVTTVPRLFSSLSQSLSVTVALVGVTLIGSYYLYRRLSLSAFGRTLHAIREDSKVPRALGKNVLVFKVKSLALGAGLMGLAGALMAHYLGFFNPSVFPLSITFLIWSGLILGGSGSYRGAILGSVMLGVIHQLVRYIPSSIPFASELPHLRTMFIGLVLITVLYYRPYGLIGDKERLAAGGKSL